MIKKLIAAAAFAVSVFPVYADGESLAETGGYVPTDAPALAFKNITLADLGKTWLPAAKRGGGSAGGEASVPLILRTEEKTDGVLTAVSYQAQWEDDGYLKSATIKFTNGEGGVYAQTVAAKYTGTGIRAAYLTDFSGSAGYTSSGLDIAGYGFLDLKLYEASGSNVESININFNYSQDTKVWTTSAVGAGPYAVGGRVWSQMNATRGNELPCVTVVGHDNNAEFYAPSSAKVLIFDTNGAWGDAAYSAPNEIRYGYIDENGYPTPTVIVRDIPFERYKVVFYASSDTNDGKFGYVTVNGVNYTSTNTDKAESGEFQTVVGTDSWGKSRVTSDPIEGVNYLVTPATSARTLTVTGHKISSTERGCIAALQIIKVDEAPANEYSLELTGDVFWSSLADFTGGSDKIIYINNDYGKATVTFDTNVEAALVAVTGSGSTTLKFTDPAYDNVATFNFKGVVGEVGIDDEIQSKTPILPSSGDVRYCGTNVLYTVPGNGSNIDYGVVLDQPVTMDGEAQLTLVGNKKLLAFDENCNASFVKMVLGNYGSAVQTIEQRGGSISVTGTTLNGNQSSLLFAHYGSTVTMRNLGGAFTGNAAVRFGWDGTMNWTIGDGESDNATAVVTVPGLQSGYGRSNSAVLTLTQGGTLNLGAFGIQANSANASYAFSGGTLCFTADSQISSLNSPISLAAQTTSTLDTGSFTVTNGTIITGSGNLVKKGAGTLRMSASASATGTLQVDAGTLSLDPGVVWAGEVSLGENGTLDIVDDSIDEASTLYISVGRTLTIGDGTVTINGTALNTEIWELSGGTLVNKTLKNAITTATGDLAFSTATWNNALGDSVVVDWAGYLSEVRVNAANNAPATVTVDENAAQVKDFVVDGAGDLVFVASGNGDVSAESYNFSTASGRVEYTLPTGVSPVISGANTVLSGGGSGTPTVAAGKTLTLGPWGATEDDTTYTCALFQPAVGSTLIFAPGEGKIQKSGGFGGTNPATTIGVTNGTLAVNMSGGNDSVFFGANSVRIDNGGILSLEAQDALGYGNARILTINKGGVLAVKVRDTLRRTVNFYGGSITIEGVNSGRGLDFHGCEMNVFDDSSVDQLEAQSTVMLRRGETVINVSDGKSLALNCNITAEDANKTILVQSASGAVNQNGAVVVNGYTDSSTTPRQTFHGVTTIGASGRAVMYDLNCEHQNGTYVVNAGSRLRGTGSITGNGGVTLAAANSKLCGSLTVNNVTATSGGAYGDQWNAVAAKVVGSFTAGGTQVIENGSLTIGADCVVTNSAEVANTTDAAFQIKSNGNLKLEKALTVAGLTVNAGGTITVTVNTGSVATLTVSGTATYDGAVNFVIARNGGGARSNVPLLRSSVAPSLSNCTVSDADGVKQWMLVVEEDGGVYTVSATPKGGFFLYLR